MHARARPLSSSLLALRVPAQQPARARPDSLPVYKEQQVMIPMRDGVKLNTRIYVPETGVAALPFLMTRTPYGIAGSGAALEAKGSYAELAREQIHLRLPGHPRALRFRGTSSS